MTNAGESMVKIAMNQHGTRALQKMIEFVTTDEQVGYFALFNFKGKTNTNRNKSSSMLSELRSCP